MKCVRCSYDMGSIPDSFYWHGENSPSSEEEMLRGADVEVYHCKQCGAENELRKCQ